jgi:hypothetical protein
MSDATASKKMKVRVGLAVISLGLSALLFQNFSQDTGLGQPINLTVRQGRSEPAGHKFSSLQEALDFVGAMERRPQAVKISVDAGFYPLTKPLVINFPELRTGNMELSIEATREGTATVSGVQGIIKSGWSAESDRVVSVDVPNAPAGFRSLYANDDFNRIRSRHPNYPRFYAIEDAPPKPEDTTKPDPGKKAFFIKQDIGADWDFNEVEVVGLQMYRAPRMRIESLGSADENGLRLLTFRNEAQATYDLAEFSPMLKKAGNKYRFFVENVATVDAPGEWYYDVKSKQLKYYLLSDEQLVDGAIVKRGNGRIVEFYIPAKIFQSQPLLQIGAKNSRVQKVSIKGMRFAHTDWNMPQGYHVGSQALSPPSEALMFTRGLIELYCVTCTIQRNHLSSSGGDGIRIVGASNLIKANTLERIGGSGIVIGSRFERGTGRQLSSYNRVWLNTLTDIGFVHQEGVGIISYLSDYIEIAYNHLKNVAYSGISVGWDWSDRFELIGNKIMFNRIEGAMKILNDGAAIYVVGIQKESVILNNYIDGVPLATQSVPEAVYGIYLDRGSAQFTISNNFIGPSLNASLKMARPTRVIIENNYFVDDGKLQGPFILASQSFREEKDGRANVLRRNIFYSTTSQSGPWLKSYGAPFFSSDLNSFYAEDGAPEFDSAWTKAGFEKRSQVGIDPQFSWGSAPTDAILDASSPAIQGLGIKRNDYSNVGPGSQALRPPVPDPLNFLHSGGAGSQVKRP